MEPNERFPHGDKMLEGKIFSINKKGFGFISCIEIPFTRIYFHWTCLSPQTINFAELHKGDPVEFILEKKEDGSFKAIKIFVLEREEPKQAESEQSK